MENNVGIIREVDKLGRIVIPKEFRTLFKLDSIVEVVGTESGVVIRNPEYKLVKIDKDEKN